MEVPVNVYINLVHRGVTEDSTLHTLSLY